MVQAGLAARSRGDGMSLPGEIRNEQCANPGVYPVSSVRIPQTEHPVSTARRGDPELRRMLRAYWNLARHPGPGEGVCARPSPAQGAVPRIQGLAAKEINVGPAATHASRRSPGEGFPLSASILCIATTISRRDHAAAGGRRPLERRRQERHGLQWTPQGQSLGAHRMGAATRPSPSIEAAEGASEDPGPSRR